MSPSTSSDDSPCGPGSPPVRSGFNQRAETETFPAGRPVASSTVTHSATTGRPSARGDRSIRASPIKPCSRGYSDRDVLNACDHGHRITSKGDGRGVLIGLSQEQCLRRRIRPTAADGERSTLCETTAWHLPRKSAHKKRGGEYRRSTRSNVCRHKGQVWIDTTARG